MTDFIKKKVRRQPVESVEMGGPEVKPNKADFPINCHFVETRFPITPSSECCKVNDRSMNPFTVGKVSPGWRSASALRRCQAASVLSTKSHLAHSHRKNGRFTTDRKTFVG